MSFEGFTRPFQWKPVWPPAPARPAAPEDKPEQGVAVLRGLGGKVIDLTMSETSSWSKSRLVEKERVVDVQRVYQKAKRPDGAAEINKENYVDVETVTQLTMQDGMGVEQIQWYRATHPADNIDTIETGKVIPNETRPMPDTPL